MLLAEFVVYFRKALNELDVNFSLGLAHKEGNSVGDMLRSDFQLSADVMLAQVTEELVLFVREKHIVKAQPGADENFFSPAETS